MLSGSQYSLPQLSAISTPSASNYFPETRKRKRLEVKNTPPEGFENSLKQKLGDTIAKQVMDLYRRIAAIEKVTSHSFTDPYAGSIYKELIDLGADVGEDISPLDINVDSASIPQALHDAVADLGENELMKASRNFVVRRSEMVCRSDINLILFKALLLAEKEIGKDKKLDQAIAERIGLKARDRSPQAEDPLTGFFLETGPTLADQSLGSKVTFHGELDYLIQVSSYKHVNQVVHGKGSPKRATVPTAAIICEAKNKRTFEAGEAQVLLQVQSVSRSKKLISIEQYFLANGGFRRKRAIVNVLTDGQQWRFFLIHKKENPTPSEKRFTAKASDIFFATHPRALAMILYLLIAAILYPAEEFEDRIKAVHPR